MTVVLDLPLTGRALVQNSPARRVPSHGTSVMASAYAIDLVPVDADGRSATRRDWRTLLSTEPPDRFVGFGVPVLAPGGGTVVHVHDGEPDHVARRSQLALVPFALGQAARLRRGVVALAGNHVVLELDGGRGYVALVHLQRGSIRVRAAEIVRRGQLLAACGNSGNSTEPHLHLQVMDGPDPAVADGIPFRFERFRQHRGGRSELVGLGIPAEGAVIEPAV